ncbi:MAG: HEAT repeat domain-containing protein [Planctomycetota bacterium]|nr:HEAT repeat domain-containing protein [Planctomycetota bacterium]
MFPGFVRSKKAETMMYSSRFLALALILLAIVLSACADEHKPSQWSSRDQSIVPTTNDPTALHTTKSSGPPLAVQNPDLQIAAIEVLDQAAVSDDALMRANAIEALQSTTEPLREAVLRGLVDPNEGVRFVAAMSVGRGNLCGVSHLLRPLLEDPSNSVRAAAIYAMASCGDEVDINPLAGYIISDRSADRANAAMVLAELGNNTAIPVIRNGMGRDFRSYDPARSRTIDLLMAESLVRLGDRRELEAIRAALFAPPEHSEMTALACQMLARLDDRAAIPNMYDLASGEGPRKAGPELRLVAATALAQLQPDLVPMELVITQLGSEQPGVRLQVANVLGGLGNPDYEPQLAILLNDEDPHVQVASAAAILKVGQRIAAR